MFNVTVTEFLLNIIIYLNIANLPNVDGMFAEFCQNAVEAVAANYTRHSGSFRAIPGDSN